MKRSTIDDVAVAAGVSVATVSRAMRGLPNVAVSTRDRVRSVADKLGYSADPAASRLAAGRAKTVTVIVPHLSGWYFSNVVAGVEAVCREAGYDVQVVGVSSQDDLDRIVGEQSSLNHRTDGVVLVDVILGPQTVSSIAQRGVAVTSIGRRTDGHPSVRIDNNLVGQLAADHLVGLGHRQVGIIGAQAENPLGFDVPALRQDGFIAALARHGITFDGARVQHGNFELRGGQEAMAALLDQPNPPTAVFALSDEMAFGALMELDQRGLSAGRDISVVGVDDHEFAQVVGLTTVAQSVSEHGAVAARLLLDVAQRHATGPSDTSASLTSPPREVVAPVNLIVRSTTGPVADITW